MKISIVIPCYTSAQFLESTIIEIQEEMQKLSLSDYEIVLVNDSSPDKTFEVIKEIVKKNDNIVGINLAKNFGQHSALMAGFHFVTGDIVVCMDDDGQTPPSEIHKLIEAVNKGYDVVYAKYQEKKHAWYRNLGSEINSIMMEWMLKKPKDLYISSYFAAKRYVIEEVKKYSHSFPYIIGLILQTTKSITNVEILHRNRKMGKSGYSMAKLFALWMNGFTAFSIKPLRIANLLGVLCAAIGFIFLVYVVVRRIIYGDFGAMGWSSLISVILFMGGIIMCILGMMGEYVGRIYLSINNAPQFVIRDVIRNIRSEKE